MKKITLSLMTIISLSMADFTMNLELNDGDQEGVHSIVFQDAKHKKVASSMKDGTSSAFYIVEEKAYALNTDDKGEMIYFDVDSMRTLLSGLSNMAMYNAESDYQKSKESAEFKIINKKGSTTIAGIKGSIWEISYMKDGKEIRDEIVVTKNSDVKTAYKEWSNIINRVLMPEKKLEMEKMFEIEDGYVVIKNRDMKLTKLSDSNVANSEVTIPKEAKLQEIPSMDFNSLFSTKQNQSNEVEKNSDSSSENSGETIEKGIEEATELLKSLF